MAVLAPITAAIGAIASSTVGSLLISVGLQAASQLLRKKPKNSNASTQRGRQLDLSVQTDAPNIAVVGKTAVGGSLIYRSTFGASNQELLMVICVADHECEALETIYVNGKPVTWNQNTGVVSEYNNHLIIEFFNGAPGQVASQTMINKGKGKWTLNHVGTGRAYVVVRLIYSDSVWPNGVPEFRFVLRGLKLYDWRFDSTKGGSGAQREDDPSTWEWTDNPVIALVNYMRGIEVEGVKRWGRNVPFEAIDIDAATLAANACDELVPLAQGGNEKRYVVGGVLNASLDHRTHEEHMLETFMGLAVNTGGFTRIRAGVPQVPLLSFSDDDMLAGTNMVWLPRQSGDQLVNTIRGKFTDPDLVYEPGVTLTRYAPDDVVSDGGELAIEQDFEFVTSGTQCQRLMEIVRREARLQGQLDVVYGARAYLLEVGDWVTISSNRQGWANKIFEVVRTERLVDKIGVRLSLKETDVSIYDWSTALELNVGETGELPVYTPPTFSITGLTVANFTLQTLGGEQRPGLSVSWDSITDTRVTSVVVEYRVVGETSTLQTESFDPAGGAHQFVNGILGNVTYEIRARAATPTDDGQFTWTGWIRPQNEESTGTFTVQSAAVAEKVADGAVTLNSFSPGALQQLQQDAFVTDLIANMQEVMIEQTQRSAEAVMQNQLNLIGEVEARKDGQSVLETLLANETATINEQLTVLVSEDQALAQQINNVSTTVGENTATISTQAQSINGLEAQYTIRVDQNNTIYGMIQLNGDNGHSTINLLADAIRLFHQTDGSLLPVFAAELDENDTPIIRLLAKVDAADIQANSLDAISANLGTMTAGVLQSPDGKAGWNLNTGERWVTT